MALTLSLKLIVTLESTGILLERFAGVVLMTVGAGSTGTPCAVTEKSSMARP